MLKYDKQFKLAIVKQYIASQRGAKAVARANGLTPSMVGRWIAAHRSHGMAGLAKKPQSYDLKFKLRVLRRMRRDDLSYSQAAALFDVRGASTVNRWDRAYCAGGADALARKSRGQSMVRQKAPRSRRMSEADADPARSRDALLQELRYLRAEVAFLKKTDALIQAKRAPAQKKRK